MICLFCFIFVFLIFVRGTEKYVSSENKNHISMGKVGIDFTLTLFILIFYGSHEIDSNHQLYF